MYNVGQIYAIRMKPLQVIDPKNKRPRFYFECEDTGEEILFSPKGIFKTINYLLKGYIGIKGGLLVGKFRKKRHFEGCYRWEPVR